MDHAFSETCECRSCDLEARSQAEAFELAAKDTALECLTTACALAATNGESAETEALVTKCLDTAFECGATQAEVNAATEKGYAL